MSKKIVLILIGALVVGVLGGYTIYKLSQVSVDEDPLRTIPEISTLAPTDPDALAPHVEQPLVEPDSPEPVDQAPQPLPQSNVFVNGQELTEAQLVEFEKRYGQRPPEGDYWYDSRSDLYGAIGHQAYGFMYPGHNYGVMAQNVSNGHTGVITNGRELPSEELAIWEQINGIPIPQGRYWFDSNGNAGVEGDSTVLVNFFVQAAATNYSGGGGGGGSAGPWNTRFSAGNSYGDNSAGYVSVPGYGPIGYGF